MRHIARGNLKRRVPGTMSKTERDYEVELKLRLDAEQIHAYRFEAITLRLANRTTYTPDFYVLCCDGSMEFVEVKGSWKAPNQDKSRVKLKVAAEQYPEFRFVAVTRQATRDGGGWVREEF